MQENRIFAKCAWRLIPFMMLLYLVNYIDRVNVGFAALTMNRDLGFSPAVFGFGAGVLLISYALFQVPANAMLQRLGARRWMALILLVWGAVSAACALVRDPLSFYALRFLLGAAEAGFFPGMIFYLTLWFPQTQRARFIAIFMSAAQLSFIVGGPLSSLILQMDGASGLAGWQWLFLLEGLPACALAFAVLAWLPDGPAAASWLSAGEKQAIAKRLAAEEEAGHGHFWLALRDPRVLALGVANFAYAAGHYGAQLWLPQIVREMGFSTLATGFVVALPFAAAMAAMILWGHSSDRRRERVWHVALAMLLAAGGFLAASIVQSDLLMLLSLACALIGIASGFGPFYSLPSTFLGGAAAAAGIALVQTIGLMGGFVGSYVVGLLREATGNYSAAMAALGLGLVASALIVLALGKAVAAKPAQLRPGT
ncbi:MAG: MFS transporter [Alphaproteobacteria bacterium]|nr:MFS transporter [Alphaproteobacteria bacterium]